ncbi:aldo/keto reductase [Arthrobacter sp. 35W]|uniref:aldo/keto reductase n=1 Tax=Arthrobacter sp. 35W TaxID=1132441 RepID=UPI00040BEAD1|nr:aldo/keto reductase [Arthrobacter sp. 35W]
MNQKTSWGIIGPGGIAHSFAAGLQASTTGRLAAVASRSESKARAFADSFGTGISSYGSYQELFDDPAVDAVYIATVHTSHVELAIAALDAGKHVICEKPLSINHAGAMAVLEAARRSGRYFAEGYMYRFHPQTLRLAELIAAGAIGEVAHVESMFSFAANPAPGHRLLNPELAGGGILDVGGYVVSMARLIAGAAQGKPFAEPVSLTAKGTLGSTGVDEWATASLEFSGGLTAHISTGVRLSGANQTVVYGSHGTITVSEPWLPNADAGSDIVLARVGEAAETIHIPGANHYGLEADAVPQFASLQQSPQMGWADSLGNIKVMEQWRAAIGLQYPCEADDARIPTASGRPLARRSDAEMPYGTIDGVGKHISRLVMGCDNQETLGHASVMFDDFVERGGNAFDTAHVYGGGRQEELVGLWMANRGNRDDLFIIGKGAHTPHCNPESIIRQLDESLGRLRTDHVDLYMMHRDNPQIPVGEFVEVLNTLVDQGKIRTFGGSNWTTARYEEANDYASDNNLQGFAALSNHFGLAHALELPWAGCEHLTNPADQSWLQETGTAVFPWSSQARGFFARADWDDTSDADLVRCYYSNENFERLARARKLADELGVAPTAIALAYVLAQPFPTFPLIGPRTVEETRTSMRGLNIKLSVEQVAWLDLRG